MIGTICLWIFQTSHRQVGLHLPKEIKSLECGCFHRATCFLQHGARVLGLLWIFKQARRKTTLITALVIGHPLCWKQEVWRVLLISCHWFTRCSQYCGSDARSRCQRSEHTHIKQTQNLLDTDLSAGISENCLDLELPWSIVHSTRVVWTRLMTQRVFTLYLHGWFTNQERLKS